MANKRELIEELLRLRRKEDEIISKLLLKEEGIKFSPELMISSEEKKKKAEISNILQSLTVPVNIKGYSYVRTAILLVLKNPSLLEAIVKKLYSTVAAEYNTTPARVERAIRHAIEVSWVRGNPKVYESIFKYSRETSKAKPTNSEFIAMIADKMLLL